MSRPLLKNESLNESGFTLIETLIAFALIAVFISGIASFSVYKGKSAEGTRTISSRDKILDSITTSLRMDASLRNSIRAEGNEALFNCVTPTVAFVDPGTAGKCESNRKFPITIYGPSSAIATGVMTGAISGPPEAPVFYDSWGASCDAATAALSNSNCMIGVSTEFRPQCPPDSFGGSPKDRCDVAETILITYTIQRRDGSGSSITDAFRKKIEGDVVSDVNAVTGNVPSIGPQIIPMPSPVPTPSGGFPSPGPEPTDTPETPDPTPPKPLICPGDTVPFVSTSGTTQCACRKGYVLKNNRGRCVWIGI